MIYDNSEDVYLYVGENIKFINDTTFCRYTLYTCISGKDINLHFNYLDDRVSEFEKKANVIRFDEEVFNKLMTIRYKGEDELEYGLSEQTIRGIKYDYREMTEEFSFKPDEAKRYIKNNVRK